jgi:acylphosphatase
MHVIVRGRVQGVFFRVKIQELARSLDLAGWVRNRADESLEIVARGPAEKLALLRDWARHGPPGAAVESVEEIEDEEVGELSGFYVRGTR